MHFTKEVQQEEQQETKKEFELIKEGKYEFTISSEWKKTKVGTPYIGLVFQVRKDVPQDFGGRLVFDGIYKSKTNENEYQSNKINALLAAIENSPSDFEDYDEVIQFLNGQNIQASVIIKKADPTVPNSKDRNEIKYLSYEKTKIGEWGETVPEAYKTGATNTTNDLNDDDLPW